MFNSSTRGKGPVLNDTMKILAPSPPYNTPGCMVYHKLVPNGQCASGVASGEGGGGVNMCSGMLGR